MTGTGQRQVTRWLGHAITGIMVLCAVVVTVVALRSELRPPTTATASTATVYRPTAAPRGRALASVGHRIGSPTAKVTFVEFADFQCPYCDALYGTLAELRRRHPTDVSIVYRHYPSPAHPFAEAAAIASECAAAQGRFDEYGDLLFRLQDSIGHVSWAAFAKTAGVADVGAFERCRALPATRAIVAADVAAGARMGISATPTLFLNDEMLVGAIPIDQLEAWMRAAGYQLASGPR